MTLSYRSCCALQVQRCGGVNEALAVLRQTPSSETQKHLTGNADRNKHTTLR